MTRYLSVDSENLGHMNRCYDIMVVTSKKHYMCVFILFIYAANALHMT
jgi:hypothetical protein